MSDLALLLIGVIGKMFIFAVQKFPLVRDFKPKRFTFLRELFDCDFCLGVWVYFFLAACFHVALFSQLMYFPVISEMATGVIVSLLIHLIALGWKAKFNVTIL